MSTLRADSVSPAAGGTSRNLPRGVAAAWANLNGTGTIAIRDSQNVSSFTDNGTGDYTENLTAAMSNANYALDAAVSASYGTAAGFISLFTTTVSYTESAPTSSASRVFSTDRVNAAFDAKYLSLSILGTLA